MKIILFILFHPIFCICQINAIQAPISYNLQSYNFKDSLLLIEEDNTESVWVKYKKGDTYRFDVLDEGDTLINMKLSLLDKIKKIETSLYIAKYNYGLNGKIKRVKFEYKAEGIDVFGFEGGYFTMCKYKYVDGNLEKLYMIGRSLGRRPFIFSYYTLIYK